MVLCVCYTVTRLIFKNIMSPSSPGRRGAHRSGIKKAAPEGAAFLNKILAVSYSHMGRPHTTIGAERFHFRVRNGIGWFPFAIAARKTGLGVIKVSATFFRKVTSNRLLPLEKKGS